MKDVSKNEIIHRDHTGSRRGFIKKGGIFFFTLTTSLGLIPLVGNHIIKSALAANFCSNCGEKVPPNAKFCPKCGKSLGLGGGSSRETITPYKITPRHLSTSNVIVYEVMEAGLMRDKEKSSGDDDICKEVYKTTRTVVRGRHKAFGYIVKYIFKPFGGNVVWETEIYPPYSIGKIETKTEENEYSISSYKYFEDRKLITSVLKRRWPKREISKYYLWTNVNSNTPLGEYIWKITIDGQHHTTLIFNVVDQ